MEYFGTDGIRGIVNKDLTPSLLKRLAKALVIYYKKHSLQKRILVGNDSRASSDYILSTMASVLLKYGISVDIVGTCSSPCLAYLTQKHAYPLGMMISASHNSHEYNGVKFFNLDGEKINEEAEQELESYFNKRINQAVQFAKQTDKRKLKDEYINFLKQIKQNHLPCIIDCANGGANKIIKQVFDNAKYINATPNGENINKNAGCTSIEMLKSVCVREGKIGFAVDGDADRLNIVTPTGEVVKGDKILYILARQFLKKDDVVVGTIYSNSGLEECLKKLKIILVRAGVGDKLVYEKMCENLSLIGGENAGHIIVRKYLNTGDGVLTAILILNILECNNCTINDMLKQYSEHYQAETNIKIEPNFCLPSEVKTLINKYEEYGARIIIRPSGTEPVLRIMVEHEKEELAKIYLISIENCIKNTCF